MVGVCLRYLARSTSNGNTPLSYIVPKAKKCFTVLRWLFLPDSISIKRVSGNYAVEIVHVIANGLAHIEQGHTEISLLGIETVAMLARNEAWLTNALKPVEGDNSPDYALAHAFVEFSSRIIHHYITNGIGVSMKNLSLSSKISIETSRSQPLMKHERQKVAAALDILSAVFAAMDVECLHQYRPSIINLLISSQIAFMFSVGTECHELVPHFRKFSNAVLKRDIDADDHHSYKIYEIYESAIKFVLQSFEQISESDALYIKSPSIAGILFETALTICSLCRTEMQSCVTKDIITVVNKCLHPSRSIEINHGAVMFVQYLITSTYSFLISPSAIIGGSGPSLVLLLRETSNASRDTELKCAIIKVLVQSALQICDTSEYADLLINILAGFQQINHDQKENGVLKKLCAQCALQLLKTPHARFKNAVQKLPADVQGLLQQGLKRVMVL